MGKNKFCGEWKVQVLSMACQPVEKPARDMHRGERQVGGQNDHHLCLGDSGSGDLSRRRSPKTNLQRVPHTGGREREVQEEEEAMRANTDQVFPMCQVCVCVCSVTQLCLFVVPWTVARQAPLSMGLSSKNIGVGYHSLFQGIFLTQGSNLSLLCHLCWHADSLPVAPPGKRHAQHNLLLLKFVQRCYGIPMQQVLLLSSFHKKRRLISIQ